MIFFLKKIIFAETLLDIIIYKVVNIRFLFWWTTIFSIDSYTQRSSAFNRFRSQVKENTFRDKNYQIFYYQQSLHLGISSFQLITFSHYIRYSFLLLAILASKQVPQWAGQQKSLLSWWNEAMTPKNIGGGLVG